MIHDFASECGQSGVASRLVLVYHRVCKRIVMHPDPATSEVATKAAPIREAGVNRLGSSDARGGHCHVEALSRVAGVRRRGGGGCQIPRATKELQLFTKE